MAVIIVFYLLHCSHWYQNLLYNCGRTWPYLFQVLYHLVFELEDLQHIPVSHLSFMFLTKRKRKIIRQALQNLSLQLTIYLFYHNELLVEIKTNCQLGTCLFQLLQATRGHPFPLLITAPSTHLVSEASSRLPASSDHPAPLADTEISMWHPRRSCNADWPRYTTPSCILGCVQHVLSNQPITLQDPLRKGRVHGSSQRAPALDWSRHNYHVNILLRIRW